MQARPKRDVSRPGRAGFRGFVLVMTLWIVAAITVAVGFFALWLDSAVDAVRELQGGVRAELATHSAEQTLRYLLVAYPLAPRGLLLGNGDEAERELFFDDRVYRGADEVRFSVQDESGLISLSAVSRDRLSYLLGLLGVAGPRRGPLIDRLLDYQDRDDLAYLNGAERPDYQRAGKDGPPNRLLWTPMEAVRVLGWESEASLWADPRFLQYTTSAWLGFPNMNTAPEGVLSAVPDIGPAGAERIIAARQQAPFHSLAEVHRQTGIDIREDPLDISFLPTGGLRLTLWYNGGSRMRQVHLSLTPRADESGPWRTEYRLDLPLFEQYAAAPSHPVPTEILQTPLSPGP